MKLWQKISLICGGVLILAVSVCSAIILAESGRYILELTYAQARNEQRRLAVSFSEMADYYAGAEDSDAVRFSLVSYCFARFADLGSVLVSGGETVYPASAVRPQDYLPLTDAGGQQLYTGKIGGRDMLIAGSRADVKGDLYDVYAVMDISPAYSGIRDMAWRFVAVGAAAIATGSCLTVLLVRRSTRPFAELGLSARRIAAGHYEERAKVHAAGDEAGALAADFNRMAAAIERNIEELTQTALRQRLFIGGVTHEFKTPLAAILLNTDTLQNTYLDEDERQNALARIERQGIWLERLTQKLLTLIVLKERISLETTPVAPMLEWVRDTVAETLAKRGTPLEIDCEADTLLMDADLMRSAIVNLVDNASKASGPGQPVSIWASGNAIEVRDCGCGIPPEEIRHITEPFYTVDKSRDRKSGGSGLGLALVKEIAKAHAAVFTISSGQTGGAVARIEFEAPDADGKAFNNKTVTTA